MAMRFPMPRKQRTRQHVIADQSVNYIQRFIMDEGHTALNRSSNMEMTDVTYGQLDKVLRLLGFSCRSLPDGPPTRVYEHKHSGALFMLPASPESDGVLDYHLLGVRTSLDVYGIAAPSEFAAKLKKAG